MLPRLQLLYRQAKIQYRAVKAVVQMLYSNVSKRLDAEMAKTSTMKREMRTIEKSKLELNRTLNQLEADMQEGSYSKPEHENL